MRYLISAAGYESRFLEIRYTVDFITTDSLEIQLPAWRPGRYEIQNFAKNIRELRATDRKGNSISIDKIKKDRWLINTGGEESVTIIYTYYANELNAGTSFIDRSLIYLNFINFCLYTDGRLNESCEVELDLPENYQVACGLKRDSSGMFQAADYYQLVDSPLLASPFLKQFSYTSFGVNFKIWFHGMNPPESDELLKNYQAFTDTQIACMGEFPESEYHFLNLILPTPICHGVEHQNSTMIVLGPQEDGSQLYADLLGVSSHELFHTWNVIRIRPKELLPYDFTKENYFTTCFIAEGCTTYYGDLFLRRSGVFDDEAYFKELLVCMKRHFEQAGEAALSLTESSFDLWLDGYVAGIPQRKVSVYSKGALAALILDLHLREISGHNKSLDDVMRIMWTRFGKPFIGYVYSDYVTIVEEVAGRPIPWYWEECITGTTPLEHRLNQALAFVGLRMVLEKSRVVNLEDIATPEQKTERERWFSGRSGS